MRNVVSFLSLIAIFSGFILSGCSSAFLDTSSFNIFQKQDVNLIEKNYAAADYLIQQAASFIADGDLIKAKVMKDVHEPRMSAEIGSLIPEQVGVRLAQLGYRVDLQNVLSSENTNYMKPDMRDGETPKFILSGTYMRQRLDLHVSLRIIDVKNNQVRAVFDYKLPMNKEIAALSEPQPRIFKISE